MDGQIDGMSNHVIHGAIKQVELERGDGVGLKGMFINKVSIDKTIRRTRINQSGKEVRRRVQVRVGGRAPRIGKHFRAGGISPGSRKSSIIRRSIVRRGNYFRVGSTPP